MINNLLQNTFQKLPQPFTLTSSQIRSYYQSLYTKLHESFISNDFSRINNLLSLTSTKVIAPDFEYPPPKDNPSGDTVLIDLVKLLYDIITINPIKYYKSQYLAMVFLRELLYQNQEIDGLTLDSPRYYKHIKEIKKISDFLIPKVKKDVIAKLTSLSFELNKYFHEEKDIIDETVKKFLIKSKFDSYDIFCSNYKGIYKPYINFLIQVFDKKVYEPFISTTLIHIFQNNIEDDFSFFLPKLKQLIVMKIIMNKPNINKAIFSFISNVASILFISPPTRKGIIEIFENIFQSLKSLSHHSKSASNYIFSFIDSFILHLNIDLNRLVSDIPNKKIFNMKIELGPTQEEIHKILILTSEINISNIHLVGNSSNALIETKLDPSLIDHYFEVSFQCINLTDAVNVAKGAWSILASLIMSIENSEILINNFQTLFLLATENIHHAENKLAVSRFLMNSFAKVPFNKEKIIKGLDYVNFAELANSYYTNLFSFLRSVTEIEEIFFSHIIFIAITLFDNCDKSIFDELLPIFSSLASDQFIIHFADVIEVIIVNYCLYSDQEHAQKIAKSFKRQLDLPNHGVKSLNYLLKNYISTSMNCLNTVEEITQLVKYLMKFAQDKNEEIKKTVWDAIYLVFSYDDRRLDLKVNFKKELMNDNIFAFGNLEDFEINYFDKNHDLSQLEFEIFGQFYDVLLTSKDQDKIIQLLNSGGSSVGEFLSSSHVNSEGSADENNINELFNDSIHLVPDLITPTFPIKDKFIECVLRILNDFPENENLISTIIQSTYNLFDNYTVKIDIVKTIADSFYHSKEKYNSAILFYLLTKSMNIRKNLLIFPLNDSYKQLIEKIVELTVSKFVKVQDSSIKFIKKNIDSYFPFINSVIIEKIFNKMDSLPFESFTLFLSNMPNPNFLLNNDKILCKVFIYLLKNIESNKNLEQKTLETIISQFCLTSIPNKIYSNENDKSEYIELLNEIEKNYLFKNPVNKTYNYVLINIISLCLKEVKDVSAKILEYIVKNIIHYSNITKYAYNCLIPILKRRIKVTKEKVIVNEIPTIDNFPSLFDQVSIEYPENGIYFIENRNIDEKYTSSCEADSIDSEPSASIDVNIEVLATNQEIKRIFKSFKDIKIEWKNDELYESVYFVNYLIESCPLKRESYNHKKYEFTNDEFLIQNIKNIFASAMNSLNEKSTQNEIPYNIIWSKYALTVGPYCTKVLHKLCKKYLTEYYEYRPNITARVLSDMIIGFLEPTKYWKIEDRIEFYKLVVLPVTCVISSNPNLSTLFKVIFKIASKDFLPYYYAPILKAFYELSPIGSNIPFYGRSLISIIATTVSIKPFFYFNSIEKLKEKFIDPFIVDFDSYKTKEIEDIIRLLFAFLESCSLTKSKSLFYSEKVEQKKEMILQTFNDILEINIDIENKDRKRNLIVSLTHILISFSNSSQNVQLMAEPFLVKHLHKFFILLNTFHRKNEDPFINVFCLFIQNDFFFLNYEFEFEFFSSLIKEIMNSSILMQLTLFVNLNNNIENNIFNIPIDDYAKYEDLLLKYNHYVIEKNLGNELRLNIAKILCIGHSISS